MLHWSRLRLTAAALAAALTLTGCVSEHEAAGDRASEHEHEAAGDRASEHEDGPAPASTTDTAPTTADRDPLAPAATCTSPLDELSQRERIAQLFTVGVSSLADARQAVDTHGIGGIFLGGGVVGEVVGGDGLARLQQDSPLPLLVAIDEEGGRVSRVAPFAGPIPSARAMVATMTPEQVRQLARDRGEYLRSIGVTVDYAPSVDVSDQPDGAVIGDRSFSADPAVVTEYAGAFAAGLSDAGITAVFKHFPGHGRSSGDSHYEAVTTPPLNDLITHDLRPFADLAGAPNAAMMTGHLRVPGLTDGDRPTSLSPATYRLLREGYGYGAPAFDGVIFTDDLSGMRAITDRFPLPTAVTDALIAGVDSPLWISTAGLSDVLDSVEHAVAEGILPRDRLDASLARMAALRGIPGCLSGPTTLPVDGAGALMGPAPAPDLPPRSDLAALPDLTALPG